MAIVYNQRASRKPYITYALLAINVIVYVFMLFKYGTTENTLALLEMGANFAPFVVLGNQWWRLVTAAFLHIGIVHLIMNMLTLYFMGPELESIMGHWRFLILYFVSAIGGNLFSFAFNVNVSAGASTAIFGMFAAFIVLARVYPNSQYLWARARSFTILIVLNFISGLLNSGVDNWGHFGGLVFGGIIAYILGAKVKGNQPMNQRVLAGVALVVVTVALVLLGYRNVLG